jgi:hypothetical protein
LIRFDNGFSLPKHLDTTERHKTFTDIGHLQLVKKVNPPLACHGSGRKDDLIKKRKVWDHPDLLGPQPEAAKKHGDGDEARNGRNSGSRATHLHEITFSPSVITTWRGALKFYDRVRSWPCRNGLTAFSVCFLTRNLTIFITNAVSRGLPKANGTVPP